MVLSRMVILGAAVQLFIGATTAKAQAKEWLNDFNTARRVAKEKGRPIVLDFGTVNCYWCKQLDVTTFRDPAVMKLLSDRFVAVKIDASKDQALAQSLNVSAFPTIVFANPDGTVLGRHEGYVDAARFQQQLQKARSNPSGSRDASEGQRCCNRVVG